MNKIMIGIIGILLLIILMVGFVPVGHRGIATRFGKPTGSIRGEGVFLKMPLVEGNKNIEVRVQKKEVEATAASKDLQDVSSIIALNFSIDVDEVVRIYQEVGNDYQERVIDPAIQESVKATTAKFTAEELITKRSDVSSAILEQLKNRLNAYGIRPVAINIVDFNFSRSFNESIEKKVTAQQDALAAENKLKQIEFEAEQEITKAEGKAQAQRIEGEALKANPEVLKLRAIETWDGKLPAYYGGGSMLFNLPIN